MSIGRPAATSVCATTGGTPCRDTAACSNRNTPGPNAARQLLRDGLRRNRRRRLHRRQRGTHRRRTRGPVRHLVQLALMGQQLLHALLPARVVRAVRRDAT